MTQITHDEILHDCAVSAAQLYETLQRQEADRTNTRRQWLVLLADNPDLKALDERIASLERTTKSLKDALNDALEEWKTAAAAAHVDGWSTAKTFQDGMVTAVTRKNVIIDSDHSAMLQFGMQVVKEFPDYLPVLFKPDPDGFKKLATDNPAALQALGFLAVPEEVMRVESVVGGRINKGWERKALELLPLELDHPALPAGEAPTAKMLIGDEYPKEFRRVAPLVLERDNWSCMAGECPEYGEGLHVHHINHDKNNNGPNNLISLCPRCHGTFGKDGDANETFAAIARKQSEGASAEWRQAFYAILGEAGDWRSAKENCHMSADETSSQAAQDRKPATDGSGSARRAVMTKTSTSTYRLSFEANGERTCRLKCAIAALLADAEAAVEALEAPVVMEIPGNRVIPEMVNDPGRHHAELAKANREYRNDERRKCRARRNDRNSRRD